MQLRNGIATSKR